MSDLSELAEREKEHQTAVESYLRLCCELSEHEQLLQGLRTRVTEAQILVLASRRRYLTQMAADVLDRIRPKISVEARKSILELTAGTRR